MGYVLSLPGVSTVVIGCSMWLAPVIVIIVAIVSLGGRAVTHHFAPPLLLRADEVIK